MDMVWNRWRLCDSKWSRSSAGNLSQTASLIPGKKCLLHRADSYPSRSASIFLTGSTWATQFPNDESGDAAFRTFIAARCSEISQEQQAPGQW